MYRSFVSLGRYTPKYFILFVAMVNGIVNAGEGVEKREPSYTVGGNAN